MSVRFRRALNAATRLTGVASLGAALAIALPSCAATTTTTTAASTLAPLDWSNVRLWNWGGNWIVSQWGGGNSLIQFKNDHVAQQKNKDITLTADNNGLPEIQGGGAMAAQANGLWEMDVTLPKMVPGMDVAPLWLYDAASGEEVDIEFPGRNGMDLSLHGKLNGQLTHIGTRLFAGVDMSGQRHKFGIRMNQAAGTIEVFVDGQRVYMWTKATAAIFVTHAVKPWSELCALNPNNSGFVSWAGKWAGLPAGQSLTMTLHGFRYTPL